VDDDVDGTVRIVALSADNQSGDEGRRDDSNDDIGGQAGGHRTSGNAPDSSMRGLVHSRFMRFI
jgi:hypothetical protein